ncbi:YqaI family protein [Metabacillus fastidiosus]|uniref:YqaI family protein n=1 Tax=Metabacillus fastidiosus TaxID=1458 RepID=UPI0008258C1A|nr:hypothetical protein [Metabacillus fastidiosus]MED4461824.1 hypothetical protein [Metabacillus fastidiosus]
MRDHPVIKAMERTGFSNMVAQVEHVGIDYFDHEILVGDDIVEFDGEVILQDNLERYLSEVLGFEFKTA